MNIKKIYRIIRTALLITACGILTACGNETDNTDVKEKVTEQVSETDNVQVIEAETAVDSHIDFDKLLSENEEIFAWLQVPGTNIDCPILQSRESDDFYRNHNAMKESDEAGAAYIEMPVSNDMTDFNTVIHGHGGDGLFGELFNYENPDFFDKHDSIYVYLPDNQLTYTIFAVFERDNTSLIRDYSFVEAKSDREFLDYIYNERIVGKQLREGWNELTEYNFLITLTIDEPGDDKQLVVIGALVDDAAGTIDREIIEELDLGPNLLAQ